MKPILAITKLTCRSALRSHIFQLLLVLLVACVFLIPITVVGDGSAAGFIQVAINYNLSAIAFILSLSTIWLSCLSVTGDIDSYELHMVVTKSIARWKIFFGKWLGVVIINTILLALACGAVFGLVSWQFQHRFFSDRKIAVRELERLPDTPENAETRKRLEKKILDIDQTRKKLLDEVLVGRTPYEAETENVDELARLEYARRSALAKDANVFIKSERDRPDKWTYDAIRKEIIAELGAVPPGHAGKREWLFKNIKKEDVSSLFFRYRAYVGNMQTSTAPRETMGRWEVEFMMTRDSEGDGDESDGQKVFIGRSAYPEPILCGVFNEIKVSPKAIMPNGDVTVAFINYDPQGKTVFFQIADGPRLLVKTCGFFENFIRAAVVIALSLLILAAVGCAAGTIMTLPTAIFTACSYIFVGVASSYIVGGQQIGVASGIEYAWGKTPFIEMLGVTVGKALLWVVVPLQEFGVSTLVANGEIVSTSHILRLTLYFVILRGIPLFLLGVLFYQRRELGLVVRK